jgi:hypothetical protein
MTATTPALTINTIDAAMKGNAFWLKGDSEAGRIVREATARGFVRRLSHTQVQWTEAGLEKARAELAESTTAPIDQNSTLSEMMAHAGFKRVGSSWRRTLNGMTYVAETFERKPVRELVGAVHVRELGSFPAKATAYDTLLAMALKWAEAR